MTGETKALLDVPVVDEEALKKAEEYIEEEEGAAEDKVRPQVTLVPSHRLHPPPSSLGFGLGPSASVPLDSSAGSFPLSCLGQKL